MDDHTFLCWQNHQSIYKPPRKWAVNLVIAFDNLVFFSLIQIQTKFFYWSQFYTAYTTNKAAYTSQMYKKKPSNTDFMRPCIKKCLLSNA